MAYRALRASRGAGRRCAALRRALEVDDSHTCVAELSDALADDAGDVDGARRVLAQFLERKHPDSRAYLSAARKLANLEHANGDLERATHFYEAALDGRDVIPPVGVFLDAARCAIDRGDDAGARKLLTRATRAHRTKGRPHIMLADLELRRQNYEECEQSLQAAIKADASDGVGVRRARRSRLRRRDVAGARDAHRSGLKELKPDESVQPLGAVALGRLGDLEGDRAVRRGRDVIRCGAALALKTRGAAKTWRTSTTRAGPWICGGDGRATLPQSSRKGCDYCLPPKRRGGGTDHQAVFCWASPRPSSASTTKIIYGTRPRTSRRGPLPD